MSQNPLCSFALSNMKISNHIWNWTKGNKWLCPKGTTLLISVTMTVLAIFLLFPNMLHSKWGAVTCLHPFFCILTQFTYICFISTHTQFPLFYCLCKLFIEAKYKYRKVHKSYMYNSTNFHKLNTSIWSVPSSRNRTLPALHKSLCVSWKDSYWFLVQYFHFAEEKTKAQQGKWLSQDNKVQCSAATL